MLNSTQDPELQHCPTVGLINSQMIIIYNLGNIRDNQPVKIPSCGAIPLNFELSRSNFCKGLLAFCYLQIMAVLL